jgi:hypothetical protein
MNNNSTFQIGDMVWEEMVEESPSQADFYIVKGIDKINETYELYSVTYDHFHSRTFTFKYAHKWMKKLNHETHYKKVEV